MRKVILTFGLISGGIVAGLMFATVPFWRNGTLTTDNGELVGYTTMVIALSMVFFGVKSYRDNHLNGSITFGNALKVGLLITLVSAICYALGWEINMRFFLTDFMEQFSTTYLNKAKASGGTEAEIQKKITDFQSMMELYKNPVIRFGFTLMEILPVGIAISLLSAALLRKKEVLPA